MTSVGWRRSLVSSVVARMSSKNLSYEDAIRKLNSLQSNKATIEQIKKSLKTGQKCTNLEEMENYLLRTGVPLTKLDQLSVVHVAGTKGKGSTSAMCESILRHHGLRTGFYSSPHLVAVRERIRIDGQPLSEHTFARHFHRVYDQLNNTQEFAGDMPKYFAFLTVMAYNVFLAERVDVAVVEVGIGGRVDYTNVLRKVPVVGITSLGLDHTSILGSTLPEIAAAKAGVMKPGCLAFTVRQPHAAMDVLTDVASDVQCPLTIVPDYKQYEFPETQKPHLQVELEAYKSNASLAVQLAHAWLRATRACSDTTRGRGQFKNYVISERRDDKDGRLLYELPYETMEGLKNCKWPGRYQVVPTEYATFYLDGAHTKESMEICAQWFIDSNIRLQEKVLIFSATGDRNAETLLLALRAVRFDRAYFAVPRARRATPRAHDSYSRVEGDELLRRSAAHAHTWAGLHSSDVTVLESVSEALTAVKDGGKHPAVLITGSLHLVGAALSILDPNLSS